MDANSKQAWMEIPLTPEGWRVLAAQLWSHGDEAHAVYAHGRAQELELEKVVVGRNQKAA